MRKSFLPLLPLLLISCGGGGASSVNPDEYFSSLDAAMKQGLKNDAIGFTCDNGHVKLSMKNSEGDMNLEIRPFVFDVRVNGIHASKIADVKASILGETSKHSESILSASGSNIPSSLKDLTGEIRFTPRVYVDASTAYFDLADAGTIRMALNTLLKESYPDYSGLVARSYKSLEGYEEVEKYMPVDTKLEEFFTTLNEELAKSYKNSPSAFMFTQNEGVSTISLQTASWSTVRALLDRGDTIEASSIDLSSFFDEAEKKASLDRCAINVEYASSGLKSLGLDIAFTFKEEVELTESYTPCGTWQLSGDIGVVYGENAAPKTITDRVKKQCLQTELVLPF